MPLADSVGALEQLRQQGKIAAIGLSNVTITELDNALTIAPIATVQNRLSCIDPRDLRTARACAERQITYLAYSPLGGQPGIPPDVAVAAANALEDFRYALSP